LVVFSLEKDFDHRVQLNWEVKLFFALLFVALASERFIRKVLIIYFSCNLPSLLLVLLVTASFLVHAEVNVQRYQMDCLLVFELFVPRLKVGVEKVDRHGNVQDHVDGLDAFSVWRNREKQTRILVFFSCLSGLVKSRSRRCNTRHYRSKQKQPKNCSLE